MNSGLRRRLERQLRALDVSIPTPFSVEALCVNLARSRGRPIHLLPWDTTGATAPCGLWVSTNSADYIIYAEAATRILRRHIILHEVAHLLLGHAGAIDLNDAAALFEVLDPSVVRRVLARTSTYDAIEEREAEVLASIIGEQASGLLPDLPRKLPPSEAAIIHRLNSALAADVSDSP
jgi:hypothetical protein